MYQDLSIIIPTYNSEKTIKKVLDYLIPLSKKASKFLSLIIVPQTKLDQF